jgi:8-oxo-dGTP pyrophosphatase MutT (NUDIX family)
VVVDEQRGTQPHPASRAAVREQLQQSLRGSLADHERLMRALHPLAQPPAGDGWNRSELIDLLPPGPPVEAAVLAGIVPRANGAQVILTRRTETLRTHGGQVGFPGGRTEPDDRDAGGRAAREPGRNRIGARPGAGAGYLDPFVTITGYRVTPVVAVVDPDFVPVPQPSEVAEVFEVPLDYLMAPDSLRQVEITHRGRVRHVLSTWLAGPAHLGRDRRHSLQPASSPGASAMKPIDPPWTTLVDVTLAAALGAGVRVVDARHRQHRRARGRCARLAGRSAGGGGQYLAGHIPTAVHADLNRDLSDLTAKRPWPAPLPDSDAFAAKLGTWGIGPETQVVVYDGSDGSMAASRLWWLLRLIGHAGWPCSTAVSPPGRPPVSAGERADWR